jgi:hypothetical protein
MKRFLPTTITLVLAGIVAALCGYWWKFKDREPTPDEYAVYEAFRVRLSADIGWDSGSVRLAGKTTKLEQMRTDSLIPVALHPYPPEKMAPPKEYVAFCGYLCGREFMKRNLTSWDLGVTGDKLPSGKLAVSRVGFDLLHRKAVMQYSFNCIGSTRRIPVLCSQSGSVYLSKTDRQWRVDRYTVVVL